MVEKIQLTTKVYKNVTRGTPYYSWKTTLPKQIIKSLGIKDKCHLSWEAYGDAFLVKVVEE